MKQMLTCALIALTSAICYDALAQPKAEIECVYKQRKGFDNFLELVGILDPLIADRASCDSSRARADWEILDSHYNQFQPGDIDYRSKFAEQISTRALTSLDGLGRVTEATVSAGAQMTNNPKAKIPTVRGFQTLSGTE